jgi:Flp pilus assembly pilin Flp
MYIENYKRGNSLPEVALICGFVALFTVASWNMVGKPIRASFNYLNSCYANAMSATNTATNTAPVKPGMPVRN